jgi:lysophospholipid acyltransferase (LPLAT)-like uncharacterized protein
MAFLFEPSKLALPVSLLYAVWSRTLRYEIEGIEHLRGARAQGQRLIVALWHNELFALPAFGQRTGLRYVTVVSQSRDGELLARALQRLGIKTARGSSGASGVRALMGVQKIMREEDRVAVVTVDGPRGPRHKAKDGAIYLAHKTGSLIVPLRVLTPRAYVFSHSWDRFRLPYPFTRSIIRIGEPYAVAQELEDPRTIEAEKRRLEERLGALA